MTDKCICRIASGERKGQRCGAPVKVGNFCGRHKACKDTGLIRNIPSPKKMPYPRSPPKGIMKSPKFLSKKSASPKKVAPPRKKRVLPNFPKKGAVKSPKKSPRKSPKKSPKLVYRPPSIEEIQAQIDALSPQISPKKRASPKKSPKRSPRKALHASDLNDEIIRLVLKFTDMEQPFDKENFLPALRRKYHPLDEGHVAKYLERLYKQKQEIVFGSDCRRCEAQLSGK